MIAAVEGFALGGGCELALCCDLIIASATAVFGLPEVGLGPDSRWGGTQLLPRRIGLNRAADLVLTGRGWLPMRRCASGSPTDSFRKARLEPRI